ncbi:hypothetical protein D3C80_2183370 [compost metagenome]
MLLVKTILETILVLKSINSPVAPVSILVITEFSTVIDSILAATPVAVLVNEPR